MRQTEKNKVFVQLFKKKGTKLRHKKRACGLCLCSHRLMQIKQQFHSAIMLRLSVHVWHLTQGHINDEA